MYRHCILTKWSYCAASVPKQICFENLQTGTWDFGAFFFFGWVVKIGARSSRAEGDVYLMVFFDVFQVGEMDRGRIQSVVKRPLWSRNQKCRRPFVPPPTFWCPPLEVSYLFNSFTFSSPSCVINWLLHLAVPCRRELSLPERGTPSAAVVGVF